MQEVITKRMIKEVLELQNHILYSGGYDCRSKTFISYQNKIRRILEISKIQYDPNLVRSMFDFPLSPVFDIQNHCTVCYCPYMEKQMLKSFKEAIPHINPHFYKKFPKVWTMDEKVEFVYNNLIMMSEENFSFDS